MSLDNYDTVRLFADDGILPVQASHPRQETGEIALCRAILEDAINCIDRRDTGRRGQRLADEAYQWIRDRDASYVFSFASICSVLGVDEGASRVRLLARLPSYKSQNRQEPAGYRYRRTIEEVGVLQAEVVQLRTAGLRWADIGMRLGIPKDLGMYYFKRAIRKG